MARLLDCAFSRINAVPACDRRMDMETPGHSIICAVHWRGTCVAR